MKYAVLWGLATALAGPACLAQDVQARGREIVNQALEALGGQKFLHVQNRVEKGRAYSFYRSDLSGLSVATLYTRYLDLAPSDTGSKVGEQQRQAFGEDEDYYNVLRDEGGWEVTYRGRTDLEKEQVERFRDSTLHNFLYILRERLNEPGLSFDFKGNDVVENMPVSVVDVVDSANRVVTVYFHQTSHLPVRQEWVWRDPKTHDRYVELTRFSRYREIDGTQWPYQITRERNGDKTFEMFSDSVQINQDLADSLFAIPAKDAKAKKR